MESRLIGRMILLSPCWTERIQAVEPNGRSRGFHSVPGTIRSIEYVAIYYPRHHRVLLMRSIVGVQLPAHYNKEQLCRQWRRRSCNWMGKELSLGRFAILVHR